MTTDAPEHFEIDDPNVWLKDFQARAEELQRKSQEAQERLAANKATVENKLLRMTLTSGGAIEDVTFLTPAGEASATELTSSFRELYTEAASKIARETMSIMGELAEDDDDPSVAHIRGSLPANVQQRMDDEDEEAKR